MQQPPFVMKNRSPTPSERCCSGTGPKRQTTPNKGRRLTNHSTIGAGPPRNMAPIGRGNAVTGAAPSTAAGASTAQAECAARNVPWRAALICFRLAIIGVCCFDLSGLIPVAMTWKASSEALGGADYLAPILVILICCLVVDSIDILFCLVSILYTWRPAWRTNTKCCPLLGPFKLDMVWDGLIAAWNLGMSIMATGALGRPSLETLGGWLLSFLPWITIALSVKLAALHIAAETARQQLPVQQQLEQQKPLRRVVKPRAASPKGHGRPYQLPDGMV